MSERLPWRHRRLHGAERVDSDVYQAASTRLFNNCLTYANPDTPVAQPGPDEEELKAEFDPVIPEGESEWESIEIVIYPMGCVDERSREYLASISLVQELGDESLDFIKKYWVLFVENKYLIEKGNAFYDYAKKNDAWWDVNNAEVTSVREIEELNVIIGSSI